MKLTPKKVLRFLSSVLLWSLFSLLVIIFMMLGAYFIDQMAGVKNKDNRGPLFGAYVIISGSMIPNINVNDAVVTLRAKAPDIKVNDIITFVSKEIDTRGVPITHRVVGIVETEEGEAYRTKGDANLTVDRALIKQSEVLGKVFLTIPKIGYVKTILTSSPGWLAIIVLPCILVIVKDVRKLSRLVKEKKQKELETEIKSEKDKK